MLCHTIMTAAVSEHWCHTTCYLYDLLDYCLYVTCAHCLMMVRLPVTCIMTYWISI